MKRIIKFRAWDNELKKMIYPHESYMAHHQWFTRKDTIEYANMQNGFCTTDIMQFTGLTDKNGNNNCIYEGDIVSLQGNIIGNKYETADLLKDTTNLLIEGFGTESWRTTEKEAMGRGCHYPK